MFYTTNPPWAGGVVAHLPNGCSRDVFIHDNPEDYAHCAKSERQNSGKGGPIPHSWSLPNGATSGQNTGSPPPSMVELINPTITKDARISMITTIFSDPNSVEMVERLCESISQAFVDIVYEVCPLASFLADSRPRLTSVPFPIDTE